MAREVVWSKRAGTDLLRIYLFWVEHNQSDEYSNRIIEEVMHKVAKTSTNPSIGQLTEIDNLRSFRVHNFRIWYRYNTKQIKIVRIFDLRRNPKMIARHTKHD